MTNVERSVLLFTEIDRTQIALVGGKGAHLGELLRIEGVRVPPGFCVATHAFARILSDAPSINAQLDQLARVRPDDRDGVRTMSAEIRRTLEAIAIPDDLAATITRAIVELGERDAYAVRSSATAEDLPTASFAGQQDTYLNVVGIASIIEHISKCWASLFTERAVTYRMRNGFDHRKVLMAVVVQKMVFPRVSGILFTADPVTSNRRIASIDASYGLGEALVAGLVNADGYKVQDDKVISKVVATKKLAIDAVTTGGTHEHAIESEKQTQAALTDEQIVRLVRVGRRIEAHFGNPQDIEWCLVDDDFHIVQSRPITTLFPIPAVNDGKRHVYVSVGHQQMMTDAMKPLGISLWKLTAGRPMFDAAGRLFVDISDALATATTRTAIVQGLGKSDPLIQDALETLLARSDFALPPLDANAPKPTWGGAPVPGATPLEADSNVVAELVARFEASIAACKQNIQAKSGVALFDFLAADLQEFNRLRAVPESMRVIMAGIESTFWLNDNLHAWLGEKSVADTLTLSAPNNVTSQMGLALLDVADAIRSHPDVVAFLQRIDASDHNDADGFLDELQKLAGGREAYDAIRAFLDRYGMRCVGEIDVTRPRFSERPVALVPIILGNIKSFAPGESVRRFEEGREQAAKKERDVLARLHALPDGERKADETKRMIDRVRTFIGFREYPKYAIVSRYWVYKQALLAEAERLVHAGVLRERDDIFFLTIPEMHDVVRTNHVDERMLRDRRDAFRSYQTLAAPRVLTSDGERFSGAYRRGDVPSGALVGLAVSAGTVEGRARVVVDLADADFEAGDILVTPYTDPSWTPVFIAIKGLVTEVGGLMTHGAVIAREYGLPAVVGVENATRLIRDGQRIRVHGTEGYVELL